MMIMIIGTMLTKTMGKLSYQHPPALLTDVAVTFIVAGVVEGLLHPLVIPENHQLSNKCVKVENHQPSTIDTFCHFSCF